MSLIKDNKGVALITVMILSIIGVALVAALMTMISIGSKISGAERSYATALSAANGGAQIVINMIQSGTYTPENIANARNISGSCIQTKITHEKKEETDNSWGGCSSTTNPKDHPDIMAMLGGFTVYVKIVDSKETDDYWFYTIKSLAEKGSKQAEITIIYRIEK